jgi:hypothetical protein
MTTAPAGKDTGAIALIIVSTSTLVMDENRMLSLSAAAMSDRTRASLGMIAGENDSLTSCRSAMTLPRRLLFSAADVSSSFARDDCFISGATLRVDAAADDAGATDAAREDVRYL